MTSLFWPVIVILLAGLIEISSISSHLFFLQLFWAGIGFLLVFLFTRIDWRSLLNHRSFIWGFYGFSVLLLVVAAASSPIIRNTRSWIVLGPMSFQPVELAKIALILVYAQYFSRRHLAVARWGNIFTSFLLFSVPAGLTAIQPDLGSALILFGIWFGFLLVSGLPRNRVLIAFLLFAVVGLFMWQSVLKDYQRERIRGVFYPEENARTINYSVIQSKIAIGSAGLFGKGYHQGPQTQLGFLTEPSNDFILAALIEEWGFVAGFAVVGAFLAFVLAVLRVGIAAGQNFEKFICLGAAMVFGLHFLLNAGSAIGIFPVVGVTFPFLSYGGSSLFTSFFLFAIVYAIARKF